MSSQVEQLQQIDSLCSICDYMMYQTIDGKVKCGVFGYIKMARKCKLFKSMAISMALLKQLMDSFKTSGEGEKQ